LSETNTIGYVERVAKLSLSIFNGLYVFQI